MENFIISIAQNTEILGLIMSVLTVIMSALALVSLYTTRKMYKTRQNAEVLYIESLLRNKEFVKYIQSIDMDKDQHVLEIYPKRNLVVVDERDIFVHVFETLDDKSKKQIEPALFQANQNSRTAYLNKVISEARKTLEMSHSHC